MEPISGIDRRVSNRHHWGLFVDVGVNYFRTVGTAQAVAFMQMNGISEEVITRVTSAYSVRRKTKWEFHFDEAALRHALGARPLLIEHLPGVQPLSQRAA